MDIDQFTADLTLRDGIYFSKDQQTISYPESGNEDLFEIEESSFWFKHRNRVFVEAMRKYSDQNLFFDIGGGNGFVSKGLENAGINTVLIEPGLHGCLNAQKRQLKNIVCSTLELANFKKESIPNIGVFDVVEHIEDDIKFLQMIHNYLIPKGLVFITVPAYNFLWSNEDVDAGHYRRYTTNDIEEKLKANGFEIVYSTYLFSILPLPIFFFRTIPSKLGFNKNSKDVKKHASEHSEKKGFLNKIINSIWDREVNKVKEGKKIATGTSCFIVARKK